jgi:hypothetical protein
MLHVLLVWPWNPKTSLLKSVLWNIERFLSCLTFYPSKKVAPSIVRVEKKILRNRPCRVSKEAGFCADFKNVHKSWVWQKGKQNLQKNWIFRDWENFAKNCFSEKKSLQVFYTFLKSAQNSASFDTLHAQFRKKFSTLIRDGAVFLEVKSSNKIETNQYFKKRFFIN